MSSSCLLRLPGRSHFHVFARHRVLLHYEGQLNGLGQRFWNEVDQHINWIAENPEVPQARSGGYRRVNLGTFPYYVAYIIRDPTIWVLSIAHGHSLPEYWIDRSAS